MSAEIPAQARSVSSAVDEIIGLLVSVSDSYVYGDGIEPTDYKFVISVRLEQEHAFSIVRTHADFVSLDTKLRKKFPRSGIRSLPEHSMPAATPRRPSLGRPSPISITTFKIKDINKYLADLFDMPELLASDEMLAFLDEEIASLTSNEGLVSDRKVGIHDILLSGETENKILVWKKEEVAYRLMAGEILVWKYETEKYDIGFTVDVGGDVKVPFARHPSHKRAITGLFQAQEGGVCNLTWDNSYAKCESFCLAFFDF